jgi:hypothetical protein
MPGGLVIILVLGAIALARAKFGDASYERVAITILKWWFLAGILFLAVAFIYARIVPST